MTLTTSPGKLEDQQQQNEAWLNQQHQNFLRQEEIRKKNELELEEMRRRSMAEQAKLDRDTMMMKAQAEIEAKGKVERENIDVRLREMRATKSKVFFRGGDRGGPRGLSWTSIGPVSRML